jgi:predicted transcriptional regulator
MRYVDFRDRIIDELRRNKSGLTWKELREKLDLPYKTPCSEWVKHMEEEDGLVREKGSGRALVWKTG